MHHVFIFHKNMINFIKIPKNRKLNQNTGKNKPHKGLLMSGIFIACNNAFIH